MVRQRCVFLLGSLGGSVNSVLVHSSAQEVAESAVAWDNVMHLKFDVPFVDIKPVIYFGMLNIIIVNIFLDFCFGVLIFLSFLIVCMRAGSVTLVSRYRDQFT